MPVASFRRPRSSPAAPPDAAAPAAYRLPSQMNALSFELLLEWVADPDNAWSIGSFGVIGEFWRDEDEPVDLRHDKNRIEVVTPRGAMRLAATGDLPALAWDSLSSDGESWGYGFAICAPVPGEWPRTIHAMGFDEAALRPEDRAHRLFGLGMGYGAVEMALRTGDADLISAMEAAEGTHFLDKGELQSLVLHAQPHRVLLSPIGRIEIFQPIPPPGGHSPEGPHTHLLPGLASKGRPHSSNIPIPEGWQSILSLHPRSPWRTKLGLRQQYRPAIDAALVPLLERFGLPEERAIEAAVRAMVALGVDPACGDWPDTRRGRAKARITLRRMAAAGDERAIPWRERFDRTHPRTDEEETA
jgi:hypothetical protein